MCVENRDIVDTMMELDLVAKNWDKSLSQRLKLIHSLRSLQYPPTLPSGQCPVMFGQMTQFDCAGPHIRHCLDSKSCL